MFAVPVCSAITLAILRWSASDIRDNNAVVKRPLLEIEMSGFYLDGKVTIEGKKHEVEYEPGCQTGLSTLYLRVKGLKHCVPVYINEIDEVIEMLQRGKKTIQGLEAV